MRAPGTGPMIPTSDFGTNQTSWAGLAMSVARVDRKWRLGGQNDADDPIRTSQHARARAPMSALDAIAEARDSAMISSVVIEHGVAPS